MHRFYCPHSDFSKLIISITDPTELHHLRDVLRLKKNAPVQIFDGRGQVATGIIQSVSSQKADVQVSQTRTLPRPAPSLILACAMPKKSKFELIIEKATELGADEIIPLLTTRTEIRLDKTGMTKKSARFITVAVNAAKQSQRSYVPLIHPPTAFPTALQHLVQRSTVIIPSLEERNTGLLPALQKFKSPTSVSILIGPEGDFTHEEYALAAKLECIPVTLGSTILKVETAAICALSCAKLYFQR